MAVVITSGRAHKAELLVKILLKHGIEPVYLPVLKVEEVGVDAASFVRQIEGFHVFIFMTGQSAFSLANLAKSAGVYDQLRERLRAMEVYCRGSKAAGNVKTHFGVECKATYETSNELLQAAGPRLAGRKVAVSFYGIVDTEFLEELRKTAAEVAYVQTYHSEETDNAKAVADLVLRGECSLVVFTSGVAVDAFFNSLDESLRGKVAEALNKGTCRAAAVGPVTSDALAKWGVTPAVVPEKPFLAYLGQAIVSYLQTRRVAAGV
jgi:uroporphyrinogen-III synthase